MALPVSLAEVKKGARLDEDSSDDDALIQAYIRTAVERCDGPDGAIQRALITQTWEMRLDAFPGFWPANPDLRWPGDFCPKRTEIEVPLPPLQAVTSIAYLLDGVETTLDSDEYVVSGIGDRYPARIRPVTSWPTTDDIMDAVTVTFRAGYGDSWNDVPESIRMAITAMVQELFDGCENGVAGKLLAPYRVDLGFV
jgi:uncharacterized phiE125 gp8 family phage protein